MRVLLVEDDAVTRKLMERKIRARGHDLVAFPDAESALAEIERAMPEIVVADWMMPGMDGLELCRRVRALPGGDAVIYMVVTGRGEPEDLRAVLDAGASDYLEKSGGLELLDVRLTIAERRAVVQGERARAVAALAESERLFHATLDAISTRIAVLDAAGRVLAVNEAWRLGRPGCFLGAGLVPGEDFFAACRVHRGTGAAEIAALLESARSLSESGGGEASFEFPFGGGVERWFLARVSAFSNGGAARIVIAQDDVTDRRRAVETLRRAASHDSLTGLPNRAHFVDRLRRAFADQRAGVAPGFGLLYLDLDDFKQVNDSLGHVVGDQLLVAAARRMERCIRPADMVARLGGDEFVVLLDGVTDAGRAEAVRERVVESLGRDYEFGGASVPGGASVGLVLSSPEDATPDAVLARADEEMYRIKRARKVGR